MASVVFDGASRIYPGTTAPAVDKLNLTVNDGEFLVLVASITVAVSQHHFVCWQDLKRLMAAEF